MDIPKSTRRKPYKMSTTFFLEQQRLFLLEHRKVRLKKKVEKPEPDFPKSTDPFTLCFS